jgi:hypothetical protein
MVKKQCLVDCVELLQGFGPYTVGPEQLDGKKNEVGDRFVLTNTVLQYF